MALSPAVLSELRSELENLHRMRVQIDERTKAIEAILSPLDLGQVSIPFGRHDFEPDVVLTAPNGNQIIVHAKRPVSANNGLRVAALKVLRKHGPGRAPDVARQMIADGWMEDGKSTPLPIRVYNDLWRLAQKGEAVISENGVFALK